MNYYDESQEQYEEIAIQSTDNMPVGAVIEYSGNDVPVGWEKVNDYSTTEVNTGKTWIDGSKIYRVVFNYTTDKTIPAGSWSANAGTIPNIDFIINAYAVYTGGSTSLIRATKNVNDRIDVMNPFTSWDIVVNNIIVEYTKTTD